MKKTIFFLIFILTVFGCAKYEKIEQTRNLMGTFVKLIIYDTDRARASISIQRAFEAIERVDMLMSTYKDDSEVSRLNQNGYLDSISPDLAYVLRKALHYSEMSDGAFDITVKPVLDLYKRSFETTNSPPDAEALAKALKLVDYRNVSCREQGQSFSVELKPKGCIIDLGGIAKGYAIDQAIEALQESGITHGLVNAGGDIRTLGTKPDGRQWSAALQNPRDANNFITKLYLSDRAVATSGDYERYFDESKSAHHIMDPKTGKSATELISVTVVADKAIDADSLATAVFVLGEKLGMELIDQLENTEALIITADRKIVKSKRW